MRRLAAGPGGSGSRTCDRRRQVLEPAMRGAHDPNGGTQATGCSGELTRWPWPLRPGLGGCCGGGCQREAGSDQQAPKRVKQQLLVGPLGPMCWRPKFLRWWHCRGSWWKSTRARSISAGMSRRSMSPPGGICGLGINGRAGSRRRRERNRVMYDRHRPAVLSVARDPRRRRVEVPRAQFPPAVLVLGVCGVACRLGARAGARQCVVDDWSGLGRCSRRGFTTTAC